MSSPDLQTAVIACPNCGMRYQVPYSTLGPAGREVACAQCGKTWHAVADTPPPPAIEGDILFSPEEESALDQAFESEERSVAATHAQPGASPSSVELEKERTLAAIRAAIAPRPKPDNINALDPALLKKSRQDFDQRQERIKKRLPLARLRRTARFGAVLALLSVLGLGFAMRVDLVRWFPELAALYAGIGLRVNVVGLEFSDSKTLMSVRGGKSVMQIDAKIRSVSSRTVAVPPILVSLIDATGATVYEWTVTPKTSQMEPGEVMDFSTEVGSPPEGAVRVRLSFTEPRGPAAPPAMEPN